MGTWDTPLVLLSGCGGQREVILPLRYEAPSGLLKTRVLDRWRGDVRPECTAKIIGIRGNDLINVTRLREKKLNYREWKQKLGEGSLFISDVIKQKMKYKHRGIPIVYLLIG